MEVRVGKVTHYYNKINVAVLKLVKSLEVGDRIMILGKTTDLTQAVTSMEIDHNKVQSVEAGMEVALKVAGTVRHGDSVYKLIEKE